MHLYEALSRSVSEWREQDYAHDEYDTVSEILSWASNPEGEGFRLRPPQLRALETYWYLRLVKGTPHISDLYQEFFPPKDDPDALLKALGVPDAAFRESKYDFRTLWRNLKTNDQFVKTFKLEALRETLTLDYASYILALAMGAGRLF